VTHDQDGNLIEDEREIKENRAQFLIEDGYQTDNTNVQTYVIRGQVLSATETMILNVHDLQNFMKTIRRIDLRLREFNS
jgi:hypothetical protein